MPQFVACEFRPGSRAYTYRNDGDPVAPGDWVKVADKSGAGWKRVQVVGVTDDEPAFECKAILGIYTEEDASRDAALARGDDADLEASLLDRA